MEVDLHVPGFGASFFLLDHRPQGLYFLLLLGS
jgi:hypothetical protein